MGKYTGPTSRFARRYGSDLEHKSGVRDLEGKCKLGTLPGGAKGRGRGSNSDYALQLIEKQKLRRMFGMAEHQFRRYYAIAAKRKGPTGENLIFLLESRLDNVVYRLGFACTRAEARQLVTHKAVLVNGKPVNIPSYRVREGDAISIRERSKSQSRIKDALELAQNRGFPDWVTVDTGKLEGKFSRLPEREEILPDINENLIVELYSK